MVVGQRPRVCQYNGNSNLRKEAMGKRAFCNCLPEGSGTGSMSLESLGNTSIETELRFYKSA